MYNLRTKPVNQNPDGTWTRSTSTPEVPLAQRYSTNRDSSHFVCKRDLQNKPAPAAVVFSLSSSTKFQWELFQYVLGVHKSGLLLLVESRTNTTFHQPR